MSTAQLLDRLERVKQTGPGRWITKCPAYPDRSPSLSIRELDDGRVLVHDFGGCETAAILDALRLTMSDLFPKHIEHHAAPTHSRIPARDLLEVISDETSVVVLIAAFLISHHAIRDEDWQRLATAAARIGRARDHAYGR